MNHYDQSRPQVDKQIVPRYNQKQFTKTTMTTKKGETIMGLNRITITNSARPVYTFIMDANEHKDADKTALDFPGYVYDQPYQRGHVWGL